MNKEPKHPRLSQEEFCNNTKPMVKGDENWNLVAIFHEVLEGVLVEASREKLGKRHEIWVLSRQFSPNPWMMDHL